MTIDQFRERMASDEPIVGGSDLHMEFHKFSQEALRITAEINEQKTDATKQKIVDLVAKL